MVLSVTTTTNGLDYTSDKNKQAYLATMRIHIAYGEGKILNSTPDDKSKKT